VASKRQHLYSSRWAFALIGAAVLLVMLVGMIREFTERWRTDDPWMLDGR